MTKVATKHPLSRESHVGGDGDRCDAHDDVRHCHVDQVHAGVGPQLRGPAETFISLLLIHKMEEHL